MAKKTAVGPEDRLVTLGDGRRICVAQFGDPHGRPVLNCHGGLVSRHDVALAGDLAASLGLRLISPDRPGMGLTDRLPGHSMLDWVRTDAVAVLDDLGVDRFSVMGWSAGGQHALATAFALADRVERVVLIAGCLPLDEPGTREQLSAIDRRLIKLSTTRPPLARAYFHATHLFATRAPERLAKRSASELEGDDTGALAARAAWFGQVMAEGSAQPAGGVDDYRAFAAPWGFAPEDITVPVHIHQGTQDALVPEPWAHELGRRIPDATVTIHPGGGHLIAVTRAAEILPDLLPPA